MSKRILLACCIAFGLAHPWTASAQAEPFPTQPIKLLVGWTAGGPTDIVARHLASEIAQHLGQAVVVENRPGAVGTIAHGEAIRAKPDGHTLIFATNSTYAIAPHLLKELPYGNATLAPVGLVGFIPLLVVVRSDLNVNGLQDLFQLARQQPRRLNISSGGNGSTSHLAGALLMDLSQTAFTHIPYKSGTPSTMAVASGEVDAGFADIAGAVPLAQAGRIKVLAVTGTARSSLLPNVPTVAEAGLPRFETSTKFALFAPAGTPAATLEKLNDSVQRALQQPAFRTKMQQMGVEIVGGGPDALRKDVADESAKWGRVIRDMKISLE